jgi:hypothetical protein
VTRARLSPSGHEISPAGAARIALGVYRDSLLFKAGSPEWLLAIAAFRGSLVALEMQFQQVDSPIVDNAYVIRDTVQRIDASGYSRALGRRLERQIARLREHMPAAEVVPLWRRT